MKPEIKKLLILNLPYLLFVWLFDKVGAAVRLSPGADASAKLLHLGDGFTAAFSSIAPSFHPADLALGIAGAVIVRLIIYTKGKNAKKYRQGARQAAAAACPLRRACLTGIGLRIYGNAVSAQRISVNLGAAPCSQCSQGNAAR